MKIKDIVRFKDELFFNGSVEIDCIFENRSLAQRAAESFVFHSRASFTSSNDGQIDTIQLTNEIFNRAYATEEENPFLNAISGYGSGKSHFCTAIAALFANNHHFLQSDNVLQNIKEIDAEVYDHIKSHLKKPNIVFAINGMENKELTMLMHNQIKQYLEISGINIPLFDDIEKVYERARFFVENNYENTNFQSALCALLKKEKYKGVDSSKESLCQNIREDKVFGLVNDISLENTSHRFQIENYLNPRLILEEVIEKLCGPGKPFDKVIVIFDEIGRYIEWVADKASMDSSNMQQLYEGIKNSGGRAIFLSFIQFPLSTYFNHLDSVHYKAVSPYVDRYKSARNFYLSTLLETVFANLIEITDATDLLDHSGLHKDLLRWNPDLRTKFIWVDYAYYSNVICGRLRIFHPLTVALLAKLSEYTQKRGPLAILKELLDTYKNESVENSRTISPVSILNTSFKDDIVRMEKSGLLKNDSVSNYDQLVSRADISPHLAVEDHLFLQAILIISLLQLQPESKEDYHKLLCHLTGQSIDVLNGRETHLVLRLGVLKYDEELHYHSIVLDSVGQKDFEAYFRSKRMRIINEGTVYQPDILSSKLQRMFSKELSSFKTRLFSNVATLEWEFPQIIRDIRDDSTDYLQRTVAEYSRAIKPNQPRGAMIWLYVNSEFVRDIEDTIREVEELSQELNLDDCSTQIGVLVDNLGELFNLIVDSDTINSFSDQEREKFHSFVPSEKQRIEYALQDLFRTMKNSAFYVMNNKLIKTDKSFSSIINDKIERLYYRHVPFKFDGFTVQNNHHGKREIIQIIKGFENPNLSVRAFKTVLQDNTFNRLSSLLGQYGWKVFNENAIDRPQNQSVLYAFEYVDNLLAGISESISLDLLTVFETLVRMPYGMNVYSATLMIVLAISFRKDYFSFRVDGQDLRFGEWVLFIHEQDDTNVRALKDTTVIFFDIKKREEAVGNIIQRILDERSIINVLSLENSEGYLLEESYDSDELNSKIILAKDRIGVAKKLSKAFEIERDFYIAIKRYINQREEGVPEILKNINKLINAWDNFNDEVNKSLFIIPIEWQEEYSNLLVSARKSVGKYFEEWFSQNKAPVNHNVEQYIAFSKVLVNGLYSLDFDRFARLVDSNVSDISETFNVISQVNSRVAGITGKPPPKTISECEAQLLTIQRLRGDINVFPLRKQHKEDYYQQLDAVEHRVKAQLDALNNQVGMVWDFLAESEVESVDELNSFIGDLEKTLENIGEEHTDYQYLSEIFENGKEIQYRLFEVKNSYVDKQDVAKQMEVVRTQFSENIEEDPEALTCKILFERFETDLYEKIIQDSNLWVSKLPNDSTITTLGEKSLEQHLQYINNQPNYLKTTDREIALKKKLAILKQLDSHMHEEIIVLFDNIATHEKKVELIQELQARLQK